MGLGKGKGLMKGPALISEKPPVLLREDSEYALEKLSSIITVDNYEDLGNHATEAMGETGLFTISQAMLMMKGLMGRCLNHETTLDRLRKKNNLMEDELHDLKAWEINMEKKLTCSEQVRGEIEKQTEQLTQILWIKKRRLRMPRISSVKPKKRRYGSIMIPTFL
ncbi:uncharacterized protein LOC142631769 [Castanea sativa]|uniref:uncharacterized protein LOC142631769 n=1 Tax=Castanea sativa TaxID=21020 RepID=UPI003F652BA1